ncbi:MAG TPA: tetratricopeptide repeat protein [Polyangiaceae bacterium]|nr:tetratricopeptide repeat protein [Polyangiaceae bacterium]
MLLADKGQNREAVALLEGELTKHPRLVRERRLLIRLYGSLGDLGKARNEANVLAKQLGPQSPLPWLELGHAHELCHRYDVALELYDYASAVAPLDPAGPKTGGIRAAAWGELEAAEPRLSEAVRRDVRDARSFHALGLVRTKLGDLDGAERAYRAGVLSDPRGIDNRIGLATLALVRGDVDRVLAEYEAILQLYPKFADAELGRSWALGKLGRLTEARAALERAARLGASPKSVERQRAWLADERAKSATTR